jgi:hypothetical protein
VVSLDFAVSIVPGWNSTVFPPYFVAGAIFSGMAMVLTLLIPLRKVYKLEDFITMRHLDNMAKVMLATGLFVAYGYTVEAFTAWYGGNVYEGYTILINRLTGPYAPAFIALLICNIVIPQTLWSRRVRSTPILLFIIALIINVGMWLERFVIIVLSLHRDYLPSSWGMFYPTLWDWLTLIGSIGLFLTLIFLFIRFLPMISIFEMQHLLTETTAPTQKGVTTGERRTAQPAKPLEPANPAERAKADTPLYGLLAEFDNPDDLLDKARRTYQAGYRKISAYSPFPIEGLAEAIGVRRTLLPVLALLGAIAGALVGFFMQYYAAVIDYPWNIGGRPLNSWPSFMIVTFELAILFSAGITAVGMLLLNRLPMFYHPVFNADRFKLASQDRFFLCIKAADPKFDSAETRQFLESLEPEAISEVKP